MDMQVDAFLSLDNPTFLSWFTENASVLIIPKEETVKSVKISTMTSNGNLQSEKNRMPARDVTVTITHRPASSIMLSSRLQAELVEEFVMHVSTTLKERTASNASPSSTET